MEPWQERVLDEREELDVRIERLKLALQESPSDISSEQRVLLSEQEWAMRLYLAILDRRIELFR